MAMADGIGHFHSSQPDLEVDLTRDSSKSRFLNEQEKYTQNSLQPEAEEHDGLTRVASRSKTFAVPFGLRPLTFGVLIALGTAIMVGGIVGGAVGGVLSSKAAGDVHEYVQLSPIRCHNALQIKWPIR